MSFQVIEQIRENFNFQSDSQYSDFNLMAQEFLAKELMNEINDTKE